MKWFKIVPFRRISQMALLSSHHHIKHELFDYSFSLINKEKKIYVIPIWCLSELFRDSCLIQLQIINYLEFFEKNVSQLLR